MVVNKSLNTVFINCQPELIFHNSYLDAMILTSRNVLETFPIFFALNKQTDRSVQIIYIFWLRESRDKCEIKDISIT